MMIKRWMMGLVAAGTGLLLARDAAVIVQNNLLR
jgi:hypothetical protein